MSEILHIQDHKYSTIGDLLDLDVGHAGPQLLIYGRLGLLTQEVDYPPGACPAFPSSVYR